jgi:hypothetical protein
LGKGEQRRTKPNEQDATLILLVRKHLDILHPSDSLPPTHQFPDTSCFLTD